MSKPNEVCVWHGCQFFLLFGLFSLLFIGLIALFGTIHGSHYTISTIS